MAGCVEEHKGSMTVGSAEWNVGELKESVGCLHTVVLDLDETLVHSVVAGNVDVEREVGEAKNGGISLWVEMDGVCVGFEVLVRPGAVALVESLLDLGLEVFIFTASRREYAWAVVQALLPGWPSGRLLSREWCIRGAVRGKRVYVKDMRMFDASLRGVLLVDDKWESYLLTPENGVRVRGWRGESGDKELLGRVLPIIEWCSAWRCDVREVLRGLDGSVGVGGDRGVDVGAERSGAERSGAGV